jgi:hypothetical protein
MLLRLRHRSMATVGPKPHEEAALGPGPSPCRVGAGAQQQPAGAQPVHPSGPLAGVRRRFSVSRRVASHRSVSTAPEGRATGYPYATRTGAALGRWGRSGPPMRFRDGIVRACRPVAPQIQHGRWGVGQRSAGVRGGACPLLLTGARSRRRRGDLYGSLTLDDYLRTSGGSTTNWHQALEDSRSQSSHLLTSEPISWRASPSVMVRLGRSPFRRA